MFIAQQQLLLLLAIMSLEEEKIAAAKSGMEDAEKKCRANLNQMKVGNQRFHNHSAAEVSY